MSTNATQETPDNSVPHRDTPILLIYFNRPRILEQNLKALRVLQPNRLFFASDGPRTGNASDKMQIEACHRLVADMVDWECRIETLRSETNFGCDAFVPKAISWFFDIVPEGIILEDDCLIDQSFYTFATQMLIRYRDQPEVMSISGTNFQTQEWGDGDYYFSLYPSSWGWATWGRAWSYYDPEMTGLELFLKTSMNGMVLSKSEKRFWQRFFRRLKAGEYTFWDGKWAFSIWKEGGISITPNKNLVTNIGFGPDATHTIDLEAIMNRPSERLEHLKAKAPSNSAICALADRHWFKSRIKPTLIGRITVLRRRVMSRLRFMMPKTGSAQQ